MSLYGKSPIITENVREIVSEIIEGESVCVRMLPGAGKTHFAHYLLAREGFCDLCPGKNLENIVLLYTDFEAQYEDFVQQIEESLEIYAGVDGGRKSVMKLVSEGKTIHIIVDNFELKEAYIAYLRVMKNIDIYHVHFILLVTVSSYFNAQELTGLDSQFLFHNVFDVPYLRESYIDKWLSDRLEELRAKMSQQAIVELKAFCGGIPVLLKNYIRMYKREGDHQKVLKSEQLASLVRTFWESFSEAEKEVLIASYFRQKQKKEHTVIVDYLKNLGMFDEQGNVVGSWISIVLASKNESVQLRISGDRLLWNGYDFTEKLTETESQVLRALLQSPEIVTKDDIVAYMYGLGCKKGYTDWAIDKFFSRLRKKLDEIGIGGDKIVTYKKRGYGLHNLSIDESIR